MNGALTDGGSWPDDGVGEFGASFDDCFGADDAVGGIDLG